MAPHAHQLQQRSYYQTSGGPQGTGQGGPQGGPGVRGPRWPQQGGGQMGGQRPQSQQYNPNYRGNAPRMQGQSGQQNARNPTATQGSRPMTATQAVQGGRGGAPRGGPTGGPRPTATGPGGQQFKYQNNTRNLPQSQQSVPTFSSANVVVNSGGSGGQGVSAGQQGIQVQGQEPLTASMLAEANPQEQKQMLGLNYLIIIFDLY